MNSGPTERGIDLSQPSVAHTHGYLLAISHGQRTAETEDEATNE